jgi:PAS domain S-box-containing protein
MTKLRECAETAAVALMKMLRATPGDADPVGMADIIEQVLNAAAQEQEEAERQRLGEVQADAQERLAQLLSASPAVIYSFKASGDFTPSFVSTNIETLFGYPPCEYLDNPNFWRERVHPDDLQRAETEVAELLKNGKHALEYRFRRKDGSYCWVNDEQHLISDENGEPMEIVGSWSDITARKQAEEAKNAANRRLSTLLQSAPGVIYSFRASGDFAPTFISENINRLLGYYPDEYLKHADFWRSRVHPEDIDAVEAEQAKLFREGHHTAEYRFRKSDGTYCWVNDEQYLIRDEKGEPIEVVGSWSDITARKQAEEAEGAANRRLSTLLESAPAVIYSFKASGDFAPIFVSENIKRLLGYRPEEYLKDANFWRTRVHSEDIDAVEAEQAKLFEAGRHTVEYRFRKSDGTYCWVGDEQCLIKDDHGHPLEVVGSWSDVTARKTAEQEALQANQRVTDAIESISEGFSFFDAEDRLVRGNYKFAELFDYGAGAPKPGMTYEEIIRSAAERGLIEDARGRKEGWLRQRLAQHRNPTEPLLERRADGTWLQISERRIASGGSVAVYSDLTEIKESEQRAATANQLILQSLRYARRIQSAILPAREELASVTADYFLIWEPRDIVGGDFFWFQPINNGYAIIVGDCTGHGVPGAFMTLIAWGMLDRMLARTRSSSPSVVLSGLHRGVQSLLGQNQDSGETNDGLEAGVCFINPSKQEMTFAGARFSLWKGRGDDVIEIKGDRNGLGYRGYPQEATFTDFTLPVEANDAFYLTTDGLIDQIGGPRGRSFGKRRFQALLKRNQSAPMQKQAELLQRSLKKFQGQQLRRDDLTVLGFVPLGKGGNHARARTV